MWLLHRPRGWNPLGRDLDKIVPTSTKRQAQTKHQTPSTKCPAPSTNQAQAQSNKHKAQAKHTQQSSMLRLLNLMLLRKIEQSKLKSIKQICARINQNGNNRNVPTRRIRFQWFPSQIFNRHAYCFFLKRPCAYCL